MLSLQQQMIIKSVVERYEPSMVGIFGSYARNEHTNTSDLDILIDFKGNVNLIELIGLEQELTELLGIKVDLVTLRSVNQRLSPYIQKDLIRIL
jgi:predicted nucleotidyltransferase